MSYPLILTSNKCEFINYLSDPIIVKEDSSVALTKASISIPVRISQYITMPLVPPANYDDVILKLIVDGISEGITWQEIYDQYKYWNDPTTAVPAGLGKGIEDTLLIGEFYSGNYKLPLNNFVYFTDPVTGALKSRPNINHLIAAAFNEKLIYYFIAAAPKYTASFADQFNINNFTLGATTYQVNRIHNVSMEIGLNAQYDPNKYIIGVQQTPPVPPAVETTRRKACNTANGLLWDNINNTTVLNAVNGCQITSSAGAGVSETYENIACLTSGRVDPNGGFWSCELDNMGAAPGVGNTTECILGFVRGLSDGIDSTLPMPIEDVEFGALFTLDNAGDTSLQIIDGYYNGVDNTGASGAASKFSNVVPFGAFNYATMGDYFFMRMSRATNQQQSQHTYNFSLYNRTTQVWDEDVELVYQSSMTVSSPLDLVPVFLSNRTGVILKHVQIVEDSFRGESDSQEQLDINYGSETMMEYDTIHLTVPEELATTPNQYSMDFCNNLGINYDLFNGNPVYSSLGNGYSYNLVIPRDVPQEKAITVGKQDINQVLTVLQIGGNNYIDYNGINGSIPRTLDVYVNNLTLTTYEGSYVGGTNINFVNNNPVVNGVYNTNTISRIVGTILIPEEYYDIGYSQDINISYEPYNLVYRKLFNVNKISVNQFNMKISYKNFFTNTEENINEINGNLKIELNIENQ